ncbi:hypothetical protein GCM10007989_21280 [Devosia pacifica]|uniref:DUF5054 domain-containing protein n=1 Tax=Devosia pacifica TaxID=1335967 RepID=A0A918VU05_9HYPH|nr:DUF5054 domain-containing protein [Devosia pacifica]GHA25356.1 hypothetical protein GCM10007989_21280 [Devosia pacifica]
MAASKIHLVFKTHLDIGFTDLAANVRRQYHERFIPQAIATAEHFYAEDAQRPAFVWTTGAWLIWDHLHRGDRQSVERLVSAIERGLITWHALPFTTHSELMSPALFRAGLSYAKELDERFGRQTTGAKMTDVPGHTLGIVPLLAEAGVKFLHLGVNTASPVPDVPPIFRWRAPDETEVVVMYQGSYGATDFPAGPDIGLSFAHTEDNIGPQSVGQTVEALRSLSRQYPDAEIVASTLDAFGEAMWARREQFPIITEEIGDSWIYGAASDPLKLTKFRALQQLHDGWANDMTAERLAFARGLAMVAEHTWGVDIKTYLRDTRAWDQADFAKARQNDYRFRLAERSWQEQRDYIDDALAELGPADRQAADRALEPLSVPAAMEPTEGTSLIDGGWSAELDPQTGDIKNLVSPQGMRIEGRGGSLIGYRHESYDWAALQAHLDTYLQHRLEWAILDHDKPGLAGAKTARTATHVPRHAGVADGRIAVAQLDSAAYQQLGAPSRCEWHLRGIDEHNVEVTLVLRTKLANRMPEAGFMHVTPTDAHVWRLRKMGLWHNSDDIVRRGGGQLQGIEAASAKSAGRGLSVVPLDMTLVSPFGAPFLPFQPEVPDFSGGLRFNLYNNKWGTNFTMWWEGDITYRMRLSID